MTSIVGWVIHIFLRTLILVTFALIPVWGRFDFAPPPFSADYVTGFAIFWPAITVVILWAITGFPGFRNLIRNGFAQVWVCLLLMLIIWIFLSRNWAFMRVQRPQVATGAALQFALALLFSICVASVRVPIRQVMLVLIVSMLVQVVIGGLQVARQESVGLGAIGEFVINLQKPGVSVIQSGLVRWLRPYGLASHPNLFAGFVAVGLLAVGTWIIADRRWLRWIGTGVFLFGLWVFLLSFSRAAWIGFGAGVISAFPMLLRSQLRERIIRRHVALLILLVALVGGAFFLQYRSLLLARAGIGDEYTEQRSVNDRAILADIARSSVDTAPVFGVGIGNFAWYASYYLFYETDLDMQGDNVHQVLLSIHAELGWVGLLIVVLSIAIPMEAILQKKAQSSEDAALIAGFVMLGVIGIFDHYPITIFHFQTLWFATGGLMIQSAVKEMRL